MLSSVAARAQCTKDVDCKGDRVCEGGKCTSPAAAPPTAPPAATDAVPAEGAAPEGATPAPAEGSPAPEQPPAPEAAPAARLDAGPDPSAPAPTLVAATKPLGSDEPEVRRRNRTMMVGGIVMVSVGPVALLGALAARSSQEDCDKALEQRYPDHQVPSYDSGSLDRCDNYTVPIYLLGIGGAVLVAAGVPMIIYGGKNVAEPAKKAQLVPWATPTSGGLNLRMDL